MRLALVLIKLTPLRHTEALQIGGKCFEADVNEMSESAVSEASGFPAVLPLRPHVCDASAWNR